MSTEPADSGGTALLVAGGEGSRMARSGADRPKPLVEVGGVSLLVHNLRALAAAGVELVYLARGDVHGEVGEVAASGASELDLDLREIIEEEPLGSVGALALLPRVDAPVLIVNADNLTAIDLVDVRRHHDDQQAAMTQAVHREPFHMPFGEIVVDGGGRISAYREKPVYEFLVSSAVTVVSPAAVGLVRRGENINLPVLANRVLEAALPLVAYVHCEPWVDVNDLETRRRAEQLLEDRASEFAARGIRPA